MPFCNVLFRENFEIEDQKLEIMIAGASFAFNWEEVTKLVGDETKMKDVTAILKGINPTHFKATDCIKFAFGGKNYNLEPNVHFRVV